MKRNTLSVLIILFTVLLSLFACRKNIEFYIEGKEAPRSSRVEAAKVWRSQRTNRSISRQSEVLRPFWDDSWVVRTNDGKEFLVVPAPERKMDNKDFSLRRFFVFTTLGNSISDGKIVEFLGEKWNVEDHLNLLLKNIGKEGIDDFNGLISEYDINYRLIRNFAYKSGKRTNLQSKIQTTAFDSAKGMASISSIGGCSPVSPIYVGFPPTRCSGAMITYREDWVAEDGCLTSLVYTYISHTCPEKGGGSGSGGSGSGSGSSSGGGNPPYGGGGEQPISKEDALGNELDARPYILVSCALLERFKPLASHVGPAQVFNRISGLNANSSSPTLFSNPYFVHQIKNAAGYQINLDRFEIDVTSLPTINQRQVTANEFLDYLRLNINSFIDTNIATFNPYVDPNDNVNDTNLWKSTNPLGSILHLKMADNGSVIVSEVANDHWTVSTLRTPIDGAHPVSGNRKWGYEVKPNGKYTFYVSGVDRLTTGRHELAQYLFNIPFSGADNLWSSFQSKVSQFVNSHSGNATVGQVIKERPDYQSIKDYFDGKITLQQLKAKKGCL